MCVICMRAVLFMCAQSYLCAFNVVYSEVPNKRPPLPAPPPPAYYFLEIWAPSLLLAPYLDLQPRLLIPKILQVLYKKIDIYSTISHRCSLANFLRIFRIPPNSRGMPYIWSIMYILSYSRNKMFYIHKRRVSYFYIFLFLGVPLRYSDPSAY